MKRVLLPLLALAISSWNVAAKFKPPDVEWQASLGGTNDDGVFVFQETPDKGFVLGAFSASPPSGNKTSPNYGLNDYWVIRLDKHGNKIWEQTYGGAGTERISKMVMLSNGDMVLGGYSTSGTSPTKTAPNRGSYDYWVVKIDRNGNGLWDKTYGGSSGDYLEVIVSAPDGGFLLGGRSFSPASGTKTAPLKGGSDYWLVRVDAEGNQLWDKSYSGSAGENSLEVIQPVSNGDYLLAGWSGSDTGLDKTAPFYGSLDWWLLRVDASGNKLWDQSYGGTGYETVWGLREGTNGTFLVGGLSASTNGNRTTGSYGNNDYWIMRINGTGAIQWQKSHGGTGLDDCRAFVATADGGGLFCGKSASPPSGDKTSLWFGSDDFWAVRVDANGEKIWETSIGGTGLDDPFWIVQSSDGGYLIGGWSDSPPGGNKTSPNYGGRDAWLVKLEPEKHQLAADQLAGDGISTNGFQFELSGLSNVYVAEYSTNLVDWIPFQTNEISVLAGVIRFADRDTNVAVQKVYRTRKLVP
jgi:hypothetical protein